MLTLGSIAIRCSDLERLEVLEAQLVHGPNRPADAAPGEAG